MIPFRLPTALLLLFSLLLFCSDLYAQTKVVILKADELMGRSTESGLIRVLKGNVLLRIKENMLKCDSAFHYVDKNEIKAYGSVYIENETDRIWADSATYNSKSELSYFFGNLLIKKDSSLLFSSRATYSFSQKTAYFTAPFQLEDKQGILRADRGIYFHETDSASFRGNVQLADSNSYVEADSVLGNRKAKRYELFGNVFAIDSAKNTRITSEYAFIDTLGYRELRDRATLIKIDTAKSDTVHIRGSRIFYQELDDSTYSFKAYEKVQLRNKDFASFSDSALFSSEEELFELHSNAYSWNEELQLHANYIRIEVQEDTIRFMQAYPFPFAVQQDSATGRFQQMKGDSLSAYFKAGLIDRVRFSPNAVAAFFSKNDKDEPDGLMVVKSSSIVLYFIDKELDHLNAEKDVQATYSDESEEIESYRLKGFSWRPELKPNKPRLPESKKTKPEKKKREDYPKHFTNDK